MPIDPVCGLYVDEDESVTANYHGKTYYFCSVDCKEEFTEAPDEYVAEVLLGPINDE